MRYHIDQLAIRALFGFNLGQFVVFLALEERRSGRDSDNHLCEMQERFDGENIVNRTCIFGDGMCSRLDYWPTSINNFNNQVVGYRNSRRYILISITVSSAFSWHSVT